ncbi:hypothetical protein SAMN04490239_1257 [Rhodococcus koreensis]|uniref:Uncharacterized protein n=1 Tax=Rhodococcus koreensis TaxID=99653 RepID=A0A1H4LF96_9NOCA|nr:hypothetical protein SAMN04490239_1257 [Rhodococcus koreensis]
MTSSALTQSSPEVVRWSGDRASRPPARTDVMGFPVAV